MIRLAFAFALLAGPVLAQDDFAFAAWGENSGSLPPEYAWDYWVSFYPDRHGEVEYCKGYAEAEPGCATARFRLSKRDFAAMRAELAPLEADLAARQAQDATEIPVGGGSSSGRLRMNGHDVPLPAFPAEADAARVAAVMRVLKAKTPASAVRSAKSKAKQP